MIELDDRDFRALVFSSKKITTLASVETLLETSLGKSAAATVSLPDDNIEGARIKYFSRKCFYRTPDPVKREKFQKMEKDGIPFEYDIYVFLDHRSNPPVIAAGIPFSFMARELFGTIHKRRPDQSFTYYVPKLETVVRQLRRGSGRFRGIRTIAVNWMVTGESGRTDQLTLRGNDVIHSSLFARLTDAEKLPDVKLSLRKLGLRLEDSGGRELFRTSFDQFGNYTVWTSDQGASFVFFLDILEKFRAAHLLVQDSAFPVRDRMDRAIL